MHGSSACVHVYVYSSCMMLITLCMLNLSLSSICSVVLAVIAIYNFGKPCMQATVTV